MSACDHVDRLLVGLLDRLPVVLAQAVQGVPALHGDVQRRHVGDLDGVVLRGDDRLGQVPADLLGVHVERGDELDVADVVGAELDVHQAGHSRRRVGVPVVVHALNQRGGAVADADDGDPDGSATRPFLCTEPMGFSSLADVLLVMRQSASGVSRLSAALGLDQLGQPADLAVHRLQAVLLQL